jgi:hypothetical protein
MTQTKINAGEPTALAKIQMIKKITEEVKTGTDNPQANEEYRKRRMTKIDEDNK